MSALHDTVFLLDVDNTLLDNDAVVQDFRTYMVGHASPEAAEHYWTLFEEIRRELGYADYLGALQRYRLDHLHDPRLLLVSSYLLDYPFAERLYPGAMDVVARLGRLGRTVVFSDGDVVFQPRKIERSGIRAAVEDQVLVYIHKEQELACVERLYPAAHYVLIDDKLRILDAVKRAWGSRVTTVFPRQGHYAHDPEILEGYPPADLTVAGIGDLLDYDLPTLLGAASFPVREGVSLPAATPR
jgi:FMN phosphatase YigB (HAD superfamily)